MMVYMGCFVMMLCGDVCDAVFDVVCVDVFNIVCDDVFNIVCDVM